MVESNDGIVLAERDLEQRGPEDFLGKRQAGLSQLRLINLADVQLIEKSRKLAQSIFSTDPALTNPEHSVLADRMKAFWSNHQSDIS